MAECMAAPGVDEAGRGGPVGKAGNETVKLPTFEMAAGDWRAMHRCVAKGRVLLAVAGLAILGAGVAGGAPEAGIPIPIPVDLALIVHLDDTVPGPTDTCGVDSAQFIGYPAATEDECRQEAGSSGQAQYIYTYYCSAAECGSHVQSDGSSHVRLHTCVATSAYSCVAWTWWADIDDGVWGASDMSGQTGQVVRMVSQKVGQTVQQNAVGEEFFGYFGAGVRIP